MIVDLQTMSRHGNVRCAEKYFRVQHMSKNSRNIESNNALPAMLVVIQGAPIRTVGRVLAATAFFATLR
eukprot:9749-Karenia_brevis.AAC.1